MPILPDVEPHPFPMGESIVLANLVMDQIQKIGTKIPMSCLEVQLFTNELGERGYFIEIYNQSDYYRIAFAKNRDDKIVVYFGFNMSFKGRPEDNASKCFFDREDIAKAAEFVVKQAELAYVGWYFIERLTDLKELHIMIP